MLLLGLVLLRLDTADPATILHDLPTIGIAALLFFVNPLMGLAGAAGMGVYWLRHRTLGALVTRVALYVATVVALLTPWTLRNAAVMGAPVVLRSNLGLELAIGEYAGELAPGDGDRRFMARLAQIHPLQSDEAKHALSAAGGEVRYSRLLQAQTTSWIRSHPGLALKIAAVHVSQILAPPAWIFRLWNPPAPARLRSAIASIIGLLGCGGLLTGLAWRPRPWTYIGLAVLMPIALFAPFQPVMRYTYLFYAIFSYCAADLAVRVAGRLGRSRPQTRVGQSLA